MQQNPNNNYGHQYANQYPPMNQPQFGSGSAYPPNNAPPAYSQYPQQPGSYPAPVYQQQGYVLAPVYRPWSILVLTPITSSLRTFFIISGIFYLILGIVALGLEIGIIANSCLRYYSGFWTGGFLIGSGISLLVASCRVSYPMIHLLRMFIVALCLCILAIILASVNVASTFECYSWYYYDFATGHNMKIGSLAIFIISLIHTIINIIVINNAQKGAETTPTASY